MFYTFPTHLVQDVTAASPFGTSNKLLEHPCIGLWVWTRAFNSTERDLGCVWVCLLSLGTAKDFHVCLPLPSCCCEWALWCSRPGQHRMLPSASSPAPNAAVFWCLLCVLDFWGLLAVALFVPGASHLSIVSELPSQRFCSFKNRTDFLLTEF